MNRALSRIHAAVGGKFTDNIFLTAFTVINYCIYLVYYFFILVGLVPLILMALMESEAVPLFSWMLSLLEVYTDLMLIVLLAAGIFTLRRAVRERSAGLAAAAFAIFLLIASKAVFMAVMFA